MQIRIINAYCCPFQAQMKQEIEGTGNSFGGLVHEVNQPKLLPGCRFRLFTPGDGPGKQQSKTPKKTNFFYHF